MTRRQPSRETEPISESSLDDSPEPTAADPWTVTLCWTPRQNYGQVSIWPGRGPVSAVWGLLTAGEDAATVAGEHHATPVEVQVLEQLRMESRDVLSEVTRERDQLHRALTTLVKAAEQPRDEWHRDELLTAWDGARAALSDLAGPAHPDTRYLTLCQREGRKSGQVTVGESRLPLHSVLAAVQHCGPAEAMAMYPQLRDDELAVAAQLAKDLADRDDDGSLPEVVIDGDLIADAVTGSCPDVLAAQAATATAERALAWLAGCDGVTVTRGPDSAPWTPSGGCDA